MRFRPSPGTCGRATSWCSGSQTKNSVKWSCGPVRCFTDDKDAPAIVLTTGSIPEYAGYELICCIKSIPDAVQLDIEEA